MSSGRSSTVRTVSPEGSLSYLSVSETDDHNRIPYQDSHGSSNTSSTHTFGTLPKYFSPPPVSQTPSLVSSTWTTDSRSILSLDRDPSLSSDISQFELTVPCTCTFRPTGNGTMGLYVRAPLPSPREDDPPLYHISVSPNCFLPTSFLTTVERGGTRELVASFEWVSLQFPS
jgi:hypothetical protein